jgi:hypothetical protein
MFTVTFARNIWTLPMEGRGHPKAAQGAIFERTVQLPFAPFVGLNVREPDWDSGPVIRVEWFTGEWQDDNGHFRCQVEDQYPATGPSGLRYEDLVEWAVRDGWRRPDKGGGNAPR